MMSSINSHQDMDYLETYSRSCVCYWYYQDPTSIFAFPWKEVSVWCLESEREREREVGSHLESLEHIMISLLNAPSPHREALFIRPSMAVRHIMQTAEGLLTRTRSHVRAAAGAQGPRQASSISGLRRRPPISTPCTVCLSPGTASLSLLSPPPPPPP